MTGWRRALTALVVWAVHFFLAYGAMLAFPEAPGVAWFTLGLGLTCLAFLGLLVRAAPREPIVLTATLLAAVAITWQSIAGLF